MKQKFTLKIPVIDETHWKLGSSPLPLIALLDSGDWSQYLPAPEVQEKRGIETYDCTGFNTLNPIETIMFMMFGEKVNYSDRFLGIVAGTGEGGNDPHVVAEAIRKYGLIPEEMLPFSDDIKTIEDYYSFKGADEQACRKAGQDWLAKYNFNHEWVFDRSDKKSLKIEKMKKALTASPLGIAVYAWEIGDGGIYVADGTPNHWTSGYAQTNVTYVFDSYDPFLKVVDQDYVMAKRYVITLKAQDEVKKKSLYELIQKIINLIKEQLGIVQKEVDALPKPPVTPKIEPSATIMPQPTSKYDWSTKEAVRHSIRVIADEEKLNLLQKDLSCDIANCESQFDIKAIGKIDPRDRGLFQWNSHYHPEITDEIAFDPEKNARLGCKAVKSGKAHVYWSASQSCWNKTGKYNSLV